MTNENKNITITFKNPNFEAAVREILNKPDGDITKADVSEIIELNFSDKQISNLSEIKYFIGLEYLDLKGNQIGDLSPLSGLNKLKTLLLIEENEDIRKQIDELCATLPNCNIVRFFDLGGIRITEAALIHIFGDMKNKGDL